MGDRLEDMICDLGQESFQQAHAPVYEGLQSDSKKPLYMGCKNSLTLLSAVLSLVNVKARDAWSDKRFTSLLEGGHTICFQRTTHCLKVTIRRRRYCVPWVWSVRRFMLAPMIAYSTGMNSKKCPNALCVGLHGAK